MFLLLGCASWAQGVQNMEFIGMIGGVNSSGSVIEGTNAVISGSAGFGMQIGWAYQLPSPKSGMLWLELPITYAFEGEGTITGATVASVNRSSWYITPGVRLKTPTFGRVSFYGSLGGGFGSFGKIDDVVSGANGTVTANSTVQIRPVFDFAGGIDLRLSRLLSLRGEGRDFVSGANLGGVSGHNHPVFLVGLAFHF
jgi:hypothetical protein